jgi:hypothetical protein
MTERWGIKVRGAGGLALSEALLFSPLLSLSGLRSEDHQAKTILQVSSAHFPSSLVFVSSVSPENDSVFNIAPQFRNKSLKLCTYKTLLIRIDLSASLMRTLDTPRKPVAFSAHPDILSIEPRSGTRNNRLNMEKQLIERYDGSQVTESMLQEASQLFSEHYGVWGEHAAQAVGKFAKAGKLVLTDFVCLLKNAR